MVTIYYELAHNYLSNIRTTEGGIITIKALLLRQIRVVPSDINNILRVFTFSNLSAITSPDAVVVLTPDVQAALVVGLNSIRVRDGTDLDNDLKDVLDVFIISNAGTITSSTTVVVDSSTLSPSLSNAVIV
jgi:hypothetical protein